MEQNTSIVFEKAKVIGYVSNQVPAVVRYVDRRKDSLIISCIGKCFQIYSVNHLRLLHVSGNHSENITALTIDHRYVYAASNKNIFAWRSGKHIHHTYRSHADDIHTMVPFGKHIIAIDKSNVLKVWDIETEQIYSEVEFPMKNFIITAVAHPPTYLNKIILGSQQGLLRIWNLRKNRMVFEFNCAHYITCIQPADVLDVVAVGHQIGLIVLLNLKFREVLVSLKQDWGPVSSISFRSDGPPIMASGSINGHIAIWNLDDKKVVSQITGHEDVVTNVCFINNEPLLLTASSDNSIKLWIFDLPDDAGRLLKMREGHKSTPLCIRYHGSDDRNILSTDESSSFLIFNTLSETLNRSMGKAYYKKSSKKVYPQCMPPIINFVSESTREKQWDNIAAIHKGIVQVTTWSSYKCRMGNHRLIPVKFQQNKRMDFLTEASCLCLSQCGNFVVVGYSSGDLERFNIQSGISRGSYGYPSAHTSRINGVSSDNLNKILISGCAKGLLKFWVFDEIKSECITNIKLKDGVEFMRIHRESAVIAVALSSFVVKVIDIDSKAIIRKFEGHCARLNDLAFTPDGRWIITAAMDSTIKVWDIHSSNMIDHFKFESPCVTLSISSTGNFLATAHSNSLGIYLWANKTVFSPISLRSIDPFETAPYIDLACTKKNPSLLEKKTFKAKNEVIEKGLTYSQIIPQISNTLITMSGLPRSRWQYLAEINIIKKRNKSKSVQKTSNGLKKSSFFIPSISFVTNKPYLSNSHELVEKSDVFGQTIESFEGFSYSLNHSKSDADFVKCFDLIMQLSSSAIESEIRLLSPYGGGSWFLMAQFLRMIEIMFLKNIYFELTQSYLNIFLRLHGLSLHIDSEVITLVERILQIQEGNWKRIEYQLMFSIGVINSLRSFGSS